MLYHALNEVENRLAPESGPLNDEEIIPMIPFAGRLGAGHMQRFTSELAAYQARIIRRFDTTSTILSIVMIVFTVVNVVIALVGRCHV